MFTSKISVGNEQGLSLWVYQTLALSKGIFISNLTRFQVWKSYAMLIGVAIAFMLSSAAHSQDIVRQYNSLKASGIDKLTTSAKKDSAIVIISKYRIFYFNKDLGKVADALYFRGKIYFGKGDNNSIKLAIDDWDHAKELDPNIPGLNRDLGIAHKMLGRGSYNMARRELEDAVSKDPKDLVALQALIDLSTGDALDQIRTRIKWRKKYLEVQSQDLQLKFELAKDYIAAGQFLDAETQLKTVLEDSNSFIDARERLAFVLDSRLKYAEAFEQYEILLGKLVHDPNLERRKLDAEKNMKIQDFNSLANKLLKSNSLSDLDSMVSLSENVLKLDKDNEVAFKNRRDARKKLFEIYCSKAETLRKHHKPDWEEISNNFGKALLLADNENDLQRAIQASKEAASMLNIEIRATTALEMAKQLMERKAFEEAARLYAGIGVIDPSRKPTVTPLHEKAKIGDFFEKGKNAIGSDDDLARAYLLIVKTNDSNYRDPEGRSIGEYFEDADNRFRRQLWKENFEQAKLKANWPAADVYLQNVQGLDSNYAIAELSALRRNHKLSILEIVGDSLKNQQRWKEAKTVYEIVQTESGNKWDLGQKLNDVENEIWWLFIHRLVVWILCLVFVTFLLSFIPRFRGAFLNFSPKFSGFIERLSYKPVVLLFLIFACSCLIMEAYFPKPFYKILQSIIEWANRNDGFLALIALVGVLLGVIFKKVFYNRKNPVQQGSGT